jgi:hypothetical protein
MTTLGLYLARFMALFAPRKSEEVREKIMEHRKPLQDPADELQKSATFASLDARLSQDATDDNSSHGAHAFIDITRRASHSLMNHLTSATLTRPEPVLRSPSRRATHTGTAPANGSLRRTSTIRFEEPFGRSRTWQPDAALSSITHDPKEDESLRATVLSVENPSAAPVPSATPTQSVPLRDLARTRPPRPAETRAERVIQRSTTESTSVLGSLGRRLSSALPSRQGTGANSTDLPV